MSHEVKLPSALIFKPAVFSVSAVRSLISMNSRLNNPISHSLQYFVGYSGAVEGAQAPIVLLEERFYLPY